MLYKDYRPLISIITPVYNSEKYINKCVESILNQTYSNFELLLVDDGSTDRSRYICDTFAANDKRVRVFHKSNSGVSSARNMGLFYARGEWITFVDSDDLIKPNMLSELLEMQQCHSADFVMSGFEYLNNDIITYRTKYGSSVLCFEKDEGISKMYVNDFWSWFICSKLFRNKIIKDAKITFDENIKFGEDRLFILMYICSICGAISISSEPVYTYRIHSEGAEGVGISNYNEDRLNGFNASIMMYERICGLDTFAENKYYALNDLVNSYHTQKNMIKKAGTIDKLYYMSELRKRMFSNITKLSYILFLIIRPLTRWNFMYKFVINIYGRSVWKG